MELESVMLSEINHTAKDRYHMFSLLCDPEKLIRKKPMGEGKEEKEVRVGESQSIRDS